MAEYTIFTKPTCKYCNLAKGLLSKLGLTYKEIDIEEVPALRVLVKQAGFTSVPIIYTGAILVGGYEDLQTKLEETVCSNV
jgi:glutaredoxin 3